VTPKQRFRAAAAALRAKRCAHRRLLEEEIARLDHSVKVTRGMPDDAPDFELMAIEAEKTLAWLESQGA